MRLQYSPKTVLIGTALVGVCLASLVWLDRMFAIDPSSERVLVQGQLSSVAWRNSDWKAGQSVIHLPLKQFAPSHGWSGTGSQKVNELLVSIAYDDYLGNLTYEARIELDGIRSEEWNEFIVTPM